MSEAAGAPGRVGGIDLLRGLAVALVMARHAFPTPFAGAGVVGVVMFFALSGYLITGVLTRDLASTGAVRLGRFYRRRVLRLVPALVVMLGVLAVVTLVLDPLGDRDRLVRTLLVGLTYTGDLPFRHGSAATFHLWTLAVEEQFYLLWPAVLAVAWRRGRVGAALTWLTVLTTGSCVATLVWLWPHPDLAYTLPTTWAGCFVVGAAARLFADRFPGGLRNRSAVVSCLGCLLVLSMLPLRGHVATYLIGGPVIAGLTAVLLVCWRAWDRVDVPALRPLVALGTVSYAAYLWDYPLTLWLRSVAPAAGPLMAAALTLAGAALSWHWVEAPLLRRYAREAATTMQARR